MMIRRLKTKTLLPGGRPSGDHTPLFIKPTDTSSIQPWVASLALAFCCLVNPGLTNSTAAAELIANDPFIDSPRTPGAQFTASRIVAYATPLKTSEQSSQQTFLQGLRQRELIDENQQWQGAATHVVNLGDLFDESSVLVSNLDAVIRLQAQARAAGGGIHFLLGSPQLRKLTDSLGKPQIARTPSITPDSLHGRWLLRLPAIIKINRTLFTYGGLTPLVRQLGIDSTNANTQVALRSAMASSPLLPQIRPLLGASGPLWYRGTAACHSLLETQALEQVLNALDADRVVITNAALPADQISSRLREKVLVIGSGAQRDPTASIALELHGANAWVLRGDRPAQKIAWTHPLLIVPPSAEIRLASAIAAAKLTQQGASDRVSVTIASGETYQGTFVQTARREVNNALAAMRLDRWLGLHMVPVTVKHRLGRRRGYAQFTPRAASGDWLTEAARAQRKRVRPSYCDSGHAYNLVSAFDALSGAQPRSSQSLAYDPVHWYVRITDSHKTFSTRTTLPNYPAKPVLPRAFGQKLRTLDARQLAEITADVLTQTQRDTLMARLALVLDW